MKHTLELSVGVEPKSSRSRVAVNWLHSYNAFDINWLKFFIVLILSIAIERQLSSGERAVGQLAQHKQYVRTDPVVVSAEHDLSLQIQSL